MSDIIWKSSTSGSAVAVSNSGICFKYKTNLTHLSLGLLREQWLHCKLDRHHQQLLEVRSRQVLRLVLLVSADLCLHQNQQILANIIESWPLAYHQIKCSALITRMIRAKMQYGDQLIIGCCTFNHTTHSELWSLFKELQLKSRIWIVGCPATKDSRWKTTTDQKGLGQCSII